MSNKQVSSVTFFNFGQISCNFEISTVQPHYVLCWWNMKDFLSPNYSSVIHFMCVHILSIIVLHLHFYIYCQKLFKRVKSWFVENPSWLMLVHIYFLWFFDFAQLLQNTRHKQNHSLQCNFQHLKYSKAPLKPFPVFIVHPFFTKSRHYDISIHKSQLVTTFESSSISPAPGFSCFSELEKLTLCCCCFASWPLSSVRATPLGAGTKISLGYSTVLAWQTSLTPCIATGKSVWSSRIWAGFENWVKSTDNLCKLRAHNVTRITLM